MVVRKNREDLIKTLKEKEDLEEFDIDPEEVVPNETKLQKKEDKEEIPEVEQTPEEPEFAFEAAEKKNMSESESIREALKDITIDITNITLSDKSTFETSNDIDFVLNGKPSYQVVANQSGYVAHMESIKMIDSSSLSNSTLDQYNYRKKLYQMVHSKINGTSVGEINFQEFLKITSLFDLDTLFYGIYCQTFPDEVKFDITCAKCEDTTPVMVDNNSLISYKDEEIFDNIRKITKTAKSPSELVQKSLVNTFDRVVLPESKILFDIKTPTLEDHLNILRAIDNSSEDKETVITTLLFIKNLYIVDIEVFKQTGKVSYIQIEDLNMMLNIIEKLSVKDYKELGKFVGKRTDKYKIDYKIKAPKCKNCDKDLGDVGVNMEEMLFFTVEKEE
ncbi:hypothetical protein Bp8pS_286 [Bacillus phage vB_BpuM-BpSp]|nr:hypothetical protein Bp8pS_286 [Bacillus phage vB_BpuM-BpSp]